MIMMISLSWGVKIMWVTLNVVSSDDNAVDAVEHGGQRLISPLLDQLQVAIQSPTIFRPNNQRTIPSSDDD